MFFFQAEDGIRDGRVTGVQTCAFRSLRADHRSAGATVISPKFTTIGASRNKGIERAKSSWIFVLDADERCTPELATEIDGIVRNAGKHSAFRVPRRSFFLGREIRHGGWGGGNDKPIRL